MMLKKGHGVKSMIDKKEVLKKHKKNKGKIEVFGKVEVNTINELSTYYTPGVALVSEEIKKNKELAYEYTNKSNTIVILSDGTRILGLGDIGPEAGLPVMEGKSLLFKKYGGIDAIPLCIGTKNEDEILNVIKAIAPSISAINIEDIESPKSFRIIKRATELVEIPIFHDDQYGTAVVTLGALNNALKIVKKGKTVKVIVFGAGSAGYGISKLLSFAGFKNLYVFDSKGVIRKNRKEDMNEFKSEIAEITNPENKELTIEDAVEGADVIIGVTGQKDYFKKEWIMKMNKKAIVFALSNPDPEISYENAVQAGAYIAATGKSNSPNQVNNVIAFPGIMNGLLEVRAKRITMEMLNNAADAISNMNEKLTRERILPSIVDEKASLELSANIASAVGVTAIKNKNARVYLTAKQIKLNMIKKVKRYNMLEKRVFLK